MNEQITQTILLAVLLIGYLVIGGMCLYQMKRDWRRTVEEPQTFGVDGMATEVMVKADA